MWDIVGFSPVRGADVLATGLTEEEAIERMKAIKKKPYDNGYWDVGYYNTIMRIKTTETQ